MQVAAIPTNPKELRELIREGRIARNTGGMAPGHVQANLAILPVDLAFDFLLFCQRNPRPCPLLEVVEAGSTEPRETAPGADLRSDTPKYRVYRHGEMSEETEDVSEYWRDDLVSFLLGCSFSFETAMQRAGIPLRHIEAGTNIPMFVTNIETTPARGLLRPDGRLHETDPQGPGRQDGPGDLQIPRRTRCAHPHRRARGLSASTT